MTATYFSYALLAALATALLIASYTDFRSRIIKNGLNITIALGAPLWWLAMGFGPMDVGIQFGLMAATFVIACLLFVAGQMGGGDVKLLTALALWFTPPTFLHLVLLMAVIGGGASLAMAAFNMKRIPGESFHDAIAGLVAFGWVWGACAATYAIATGQPLINPNTIKSALAVLPGLWALVAILLGAGALFIFGFRHIMRRQKNRLKVPYGIAISAAALWVMAAHTFPTI